MTDLHLLLTKMSADIASVKATGEAHAESTDKRLEEIYDDLEEVKKQLGNLRVRVAGVAAAVSCVTAAAVKYLLA